MDDAFEKCLDGGLGDALMMSELREERDELVYGMLYLKNVLERVMADRVCVLVARWDSVNERVGENLNLMHHYLESVEDFYVDQPETVYGCAKI